MKYILRILAIFLAMLIFLISPLFPSAKSGEFGLTSRKVRELAISMMKWNGIF